MKLIAKEAVLLLSFLLICAIYAAPRVRAAPNLVEPDSPDPLNVAWFVTDADGTPIDGAWLTIYWSTSPSGTFTEMEDSDVEDKIAGLYQNPIITGTWNKDLPKAYAIADLHITDVQLYYFYVKIEFDSTVQYWPTATSIKPGDPSWGLVPPNTKGFVSAPGIGDGYVATGNGFGNGPTTAYPTGPGVPPVIPEVPFGTIVSFLSMFTVLAGFVGVRRFRPKSH